jgi:hypothetical protein
VDGPHVRPHHYLLDNVRDYADDRAGGRFNALAHCFPDREVASRAHDVFADAHASLVTTLDGLDLPRPELARALLGKRLGLVGRKALRTMPPPHRADGTAPTVTGLTTLSTATADTVTSYQSAYGSAPGERHERRRRSCWHRCDCCCDGADCCDCCCDCLP